MKNLTNSYIVLKRGGLQNGRVVRTDGRFRVGANNPQEAIEFCKQQLGKTHGYRVYYKEPGRTLRRGLILDDSLVPDPFFEMDGEVYIRTEETSAEKGFDIETNQPTITLSRKFVKRYARSVHDVRWIEEHTFVGDYEIKYFYKHEDQYKNKPNPQRYRP